MHGYVSFYMDRKPKYKPTSPPGWEHYIRRKKNRRGLKPALEVAGLFAYGAKMTGGQQAMLQYRRLYFRRKMKKLNSRALLEYLNEEVR